MRIRWNVLAPLLILLVGAVTYANSFQGVFILDDAGWLMKNLQEPSLASHVMGSTRPLVGALFHYNYRLSGAHPADYHMVNLLIHVFASLLLYGMVRRSLALPGVVAPSHARHLLPLFSALIWMVHPMQTESVTYIVQRAESLMSLFLLLTLYSVVRGATGERRRTWFAVAIGACALGMLTKPIMVTAPLVVLLYDRTFLSGNCREAFRERWGLYTGLATTWLVLAWLVLSPNESSATTGLSVGSVSPLGYLATQPGVMLHYLKVMAWPHRLCLDLAWPPAVGLRAIVPPSLVMLLLISATAVLTWRRSAVGFCMAWFFVILAPSSSIITIADFAVEHRVYLALAGPVVLAVVGVLALASRLPARLQSGRLGLMVPTLILSLVTCALAARTVARNGDYASLEAITRSTTEVSPHNFRARVLWLDALLAGHQDERAAREAHRLIADTERVMDSELPVYTISSCVPGYYRPAAYSRLGKALLRLDRAEEALTAYLMSLRYRPNNEGAHYGAGVALLGLGRYDEALMAAERAIELNPRDAGLYTLKALVLIRAGRATEAIPWFEEAVAADPTDPLARLELAWLLATDPDAAVRDGARASALIEAVEALTGGGNVRTLDAMAAARAACGDFDMAVSLGGSALQAVAASDAGGPGAQEGRGAVASTRQGIEARLQRYREGKVWTRDGRAPTDK